MYGMLWGERHGPPSLPIFHQHLYPQEQQQQPQQEGELQHPINVTANGLLISSNSNSSSNSSSSSHSQSVLLSSKALKAVLSGSSNINSSSSSWEVAAAPATSASQQLPQQEHYHHHPQLLAIDSTARVISSSTGGGFAGEPTSVLDLRSPSPNNSRALDSASSSSAIKNTAIKKKASSSSSSDCNTTTNYSTTDAAKVKSKGDQQQQQQQISSSLAQSSSSADEQQQLQDELEQAVAAASGGYGLPLFYSSQGIRQMENYGGYDQHQQQQQQQELLHQGRSDQWLLQDVVEGQHDDLLHHQQQQQHGTHKFEELASELLGSCPSPAAVVVPPESSSFMRWLFEETSSAPPLPSSTSPAGGAASAGGDTNVLPNPPWQQHMMMMVKHEQQQQQPSPLSSSSLPPHLAHIESFTRRTLPLVSSGAPLFHHPHSIQFQDPLALSSGGMNLLWQQQQQQQHHLQIGLEQQQQQPRDPFLLGMIQDEQHQQHIPNLFGHSSSGSLLQASPTSFHTGLFMENLGSHQGGLARQTSRTPPFLEEQILLRSQLPQQSHKREHQSGQQHHDLPHPSSKVARLSPPNSQPGHPPQPQHDSTSGVFPSRLLLHAAEACESGQEKLAQSILARLNDHHHHQLFLQQQEHHRSQQFHELHVPQARRIGLLFREILVERLSKRQAAATSSSSSSPAEAGIVERIAACKSLYDASNLLKCAHFIANQAISEAIESEECVHILDLSEAANSLSMNSSFGCQWSSFVASTLQQKFSRPIKIRITLASTRQHALNFALESLKELARDHPNNGRCAEFEFCGVLTRPGSPLSLSDMGIKMHEVLVVNFVLGLHKLVPVTETLESVRASNPKIMLLVEQEMEPIKPSFVERFREGLDYYTGLAESVASDENFLDDADKVEQLVWKSEIEELLAGNLEHQRLEKWKLWMSQAGFCCSRLSDMCEKVALGLFNFEKTGNNTKTRGFDLVREDGSLLLGFRGKILASASAWKCC